MNGNISKFLLEKNYVLQYGVFVNSKQPLANKDFQDAYIDAREKEGRIYDTSALRQLPVAPENHPLAKEWRIRKRSADKFVKYPESKGTGLKVLEIGCGNGWLTHYLAKKLPESQFTGMDVNLPELKMAAEAFKTAENITWLYEEITHHDILPEHYFDIIYFAASIQYFSDLKSLFGTVAKYLAPSGEIHVMDSPFYTEKQAETARHRTMDYYGQTAPEMTNYYFHHTLKNLYESGFRIKMMNRTTPFSFLKKLDKMGWWDYFGWFCVETQ